MNEISEFYDISPEISEDIAVWPGDSPFERTVLSDFTPETRYFLSTIRTTVHLGAHADAPLHYHPAGSGIESRKLSYYLGPCQVLSVSKPPASRIELKDLAERKIQAKRVLFKTESFPNPNQWNSDFVSLSAELINFLANQGVCLVGIDTPSIDLSNDKELLAHHAVYENDMAILEGIVLSKVPDGLYTLVALPLKLKNADASPVRAVLIKKGGI